MYKPNFRFFLQGSATLVFLAAAQLRAQSPDLPASPIREKVVTACNECHESSIIVQQRLSKAAWTKEIDKMMKWGALVDPADRDAIIGYLSANFPPDKAAEVMPRTRSKP